MSVTAGARPTRRQWLPGVGESALLAALAIWSLLPLLLLFVGKPDGTFTGADGIQTADQLQYMAWIRGAGDHVLFSNLFDVGPDPHLFLHPMFALSGVLWRLGLSIQLALLVWKPVAVLVVFFGFAAYVRRMLPGRPVGRWVALAVALFFYSPAAPLTDWLHIGSPDLRFGSLSMALELFPAGFLWGILPTAIAVGLMPLFLLGLESLLEERQGRPGGGAGKRPALLVSGAGVLISWLHPWQGLTLIAMMLGLASWGRLGRRYRALVAPAAGVVAPLIYYAILSYTHSSWAVVARPNDMPHWGAWLPVAVWPLFAVAALGFLRGRAATDGERLLRLWPLAAIGVYVALDSSFFYHAFAGVTLPLAVLAVRGWDRLRLPRPATAAVVLCVVCPGLFFNAQVLLRKRSDHFLPPGDQAALRYLARSPRPGAVLAPVPLGTAVPAFTGRHTWVGHPTWTPANALRTRRAEALFAGRLPASAARATVRDSGVAFALSGCRHRSPLAPTLGPLVLRVRRFGCATLYELR